jgi:5-deoxy-glucuronate isomerase
VTGECDLAEISAEVENQYPLQFIEFAEVKKNDSLSFDTGGNTNKRNLNILLGKNIEAGRILAGVTFSEKGNWTSYPPHEHASILEEAYLFIDMPAPNFGIQLVYTDLHKPELAQIVHEGDVVVMPKGYHPNVACPHGSINFLWMMAANREVVDRQFGVVNVQPEFAENGSGLEASQK